MNSPRLFSIAEMAETRGDVAILLIKIGGGRVVLWCLVNFQYLGVLLTWIQVGQGPTALAVGAGGGCLDIFALVCHFSFLSPFLWETVRYRLKYSQRFVKPKTTNQPKPYKN